MKSIFKSSIINPTFFILLTAAVLADYFLAIPFYVYLLIGAAWLVITTIGSFNILWNYHIESLNFQKQTDGKMVALTFDDGPDPVCTPKVLSLLKKYNAQATFFCIGKNIEAHPEIVKEIIAAGHTIGNHSYSHSPYFDFYNAPRIAEELKRTDQLVERIAHKKMKLFRPPYGVTNPSIKKALAMTGHKSIGWSVRSLDTVLKPKEKVIRRIAHKLKAGDVILLHDRIPQTVEVLEAVLIYLQENQFTSLTVDGLLKIKAYE